jgi:hypothetical protein
MDSISTHLAAYKQRCRQALDKPAFWMTEEVIRDGRAFLDAWDEWERLASQQRRMHRPWLLMLLFPIMLPYYVYISRRVDKAYLEVDRTQRQWNSHYVNNLRKRRAPVIVQ